MIEIKTVEIVPGTVNVNQQFLVAAKVVYTPSVYKWGDLLDMNWNDLSGMTWGDLFTYRNPDYRETRRYSGTFTCNQDFNF